MTYPVEAVLDDVLRQLAINPNMVLIAPPGAGKTTIVAPALLNQPWCDGQVLLLSPRRIAARMAAQRIADLTGEVLGGRVGYATRMDSKRSANTRVLVITQGIFRNRIIADPELRGVSAVLFDEVHERSLDGDFALALVLEAQAAFRPDLRILAMSATLDGDRFSALMGAAPVIRSDGKSWPLETRYIGRRAERTIEQDVAAAVRMALANDNGDILAFLPGAQEIKRTAALLANLSDGIVVHGLYGSLDPAAQNAALRPDELGRRKIIIATNIAETSLTIDGVRIIIDSGLARRARFDKGAGVMRLVTERASLSAATQRAGRAARQAAGLAYRLWEQAGNGGLPPFDPPEILESDLSALMLDCALWGEHDPANLRWLDAPPAASLAQARKTLITLAAIEDSGAITPHGRMLAQFAMPPHLAHMIIKAAEHGQTEPAAMLALLIQERGLGNTAGANGGEDLEMRLERFMQDQRGSASAAHTLAQRQAKLAASLVTQGPKQNRSVGALLATAFPARIARRRDAKGENWISVMGRGLRLDAASPLASAQWLAVADLQGTAAGARILSAAAISEAEIETLFSAQIVQDDTISYDRAEDRIAFRTRRKLGAIVLSEGQTPIIEAVAAAEALTAAAKRIGLNVLPWSGASTSLRQRAVFAGEAALSDANLLATIEQWLPSAIEGKNRLRDIDPGNLHNALQGMLDWHARDRIEKTAPPRFQTPAGTMHDIDYTAEAGPTAEMRVQALFGLDVHPVVGTGRIPLVLSLTSPAGRPVQTTRDLPAFWRGSWAEVAKEMRGRYPKHNWPDVPWDAAASLKTKKAQARSA